MIAIIIVYILVFVLISAAFIGVIVVLMVSRRSRNSTTQSTNNTNEAAMHTTCSTGTIDLARNAAYGVTAETQRNREASSVVMSENDTYRATALNRSGQLEHSYEVISLPPHADLETL